MQFYYHIFAFLMLFAVLHLIFIDIQHIVEIKAQKHKEIYHPSSVSNGNYHESGKILERAKKVVISAVDKEANDLLGLAAPIIHDSHAVAHLSVYHQLNHTLSSLKAELQRIKESHQKNHNFLRKPMEGQSSSTESESSSTVDVEKPTSVALIPTSVKPDRNAYKKDEDVIVPVISRNGLKAVIFTMDCISSYEQNSQMGGASGKQLSSRNL